MSEFRGNRLFIYGVVTAIFFVCFVSFSSTFSLKNDEYVFESLVYKIDESYIENISVNTSVDLFVDYFDYKNCYIEVLDSKGEKISDGLVTNGSKTVLYNDNNEVLSTYINVIKGDFTNDGVVNNKDYEKISQCLVNKCNFEKYQIKSLDIDKDNEVHVNDLLLLDKAVTFGYTDISLNKESMLLQSEEKGRFIANVTPNYGVEQNVKWVSLDESIVTVDESGKVTGHNEGSTKIQATTLDGKLMKEADITVDNTIQLDSYEGVGYVNGKDLSVSIKSIDYDGISCSSSDGEVASCSIEDEYLVMKPLSQGTSNIVVSSPKYGEVTYQLKVYSVYLNVIPKYFCATTNSIAYITVSSFYSGNLSFLPSDREIITDAYMDFYDSRRMLKILFGDKQGRVTLRVSEDHGNEYNDVVVDVSDGFTLSNFDKNPEIGEEISASISGDYLGELSCSSEDETKATCKIEGNKLFITSLDVGQVYIHVYNRFSYKNNLYNCGEVKILVDVQE